MNFPYSLTPHLELSLTENFQTKLGKYMTSLAKKQRTNNASAIFRVYFEWDRNLIIKEIRSCSLNEIENTKNRYFYPVDRYNILEGINQNQYMVIFCECIPTDDEGRLHSFSPTNLSKFILTPSCKPVGIFEYME